MPIRRRCRSSRRTSATATAASPTACCSPRMRPARSPPASCSRAAGCCAPGGEAQVLRWLEGGHMAEVLRQPGFVWAKRLRIAEPDATGWSAHAMLYGIESRQHYDGYMANQSLHARFNKEREPFATKLRI